MAAEHLVPGVMRCAKCEFQLVRTNLYVNSGTAGPGDNRTEPCPNGCGPLWPITWKQWAEEAQKTAERFFDKAKAERAKVDELAMLVRRLAHALDKPRGNTLLARQAVDYLRRHGLQGSPLRKGPTQETLAGVPGFPPETPAQERSMRRDRYPPRLDAETSHGRKCCGCTGDEAYKHSECFCLCHTADHQR